MDEYGSAAILPAAFQRSGASKLLGLLIYVVMTPLIAVFGALLLSTPIHYLLVSFGVDEDDTGIGFLILLPIVLVAVIVLAVRDYRRRAFLKVIVDRDRIAIERSHKPLDVALAEISGIRLVWANFDIACILERSDKVSVRIPSDVAPLPAVKAPLEVALIPGLVADLDRRLREGQSVVVCESRLKAFSRIVGGLFTLPLSIRASIFMKLGLMRIRQGLLGMKGGFVVYSRGLSPRSGDERSLIPWHHLECVMRDEVGLVYRSRGGTEFAASQLAKNYWVVSEWVLGMESNGSVGGEDAL
jgi:hypothetical protein